jgi:hypothetical protein
MPDVTAATVVPNVPILTVLTLETIMSSMPTMPIEAMVRDLPTNSARIIRAAFRRSNGTTATLRASKPFRKIDTDADDAMYKASANYAWRMLCFDYVARAPHNCMPCTADFDLYRVLKVQGGCADIHAVAQATRDMVVVLDQQIKLAESVMPVAAQVGVLSWRGLV